MTIDHGQRAHAVLSASGTYRWWACAASPRFEARFSAKRSSIYAQEGTAAHELAQHCLEHRMSAGEMIDRTIAGFDVDLEMAENVQIYLDFCNEHEALPSAYCLL